jgi:hypothetical protein
MVAASTDGRTWSSNNITLRRCRPPLHTLGSNDTLRPGKAGRPGPPVGPSPGPRRQGTLPATDPPSLPPSRPGRILQARVVQIRHRAGGAAACRQPRRPPRHRPPSVNLIARSCSDRAALHRPLGPPQPLQLRRQRPRALLQILQVSTTVERPPVNAAGPAVPIAGLGGARPGVVGLRPAATWVALAQSRAGRDGDLPGPVGVLAAHQVSPPLAWLPGSDQLT